MKYIIICYDKSRYTFPYIKNNDCLVYNVYKKPCCNIFTKVIRKILYFSGFKMFYIFYDEWHKYLFEKDVQFIVFDESKPFFRLANILNKTKNKVFVYFRNPIYREMDIDKISNNFCVYTYSERDSVKYNIKFNETFIPLIESENCSEIYDCIFVGQNKNRIQLIDQIYKLSSSPFFWVVKDGGENIHRSYLKEKKDILEYSDYIHYLKQSKTILEILPSENAGITLRTVEAVLYNKKLITNNINIIKDDIFATGNVLYFDDELHEEEFLQFINKPIKPYPKELVKRFSVEEWLSRFK